MPKTALILSGGGARAAYQVGVVKAVRELLPDPRRNPFPILCGTSGGALNAASLAASAEDFGAGVESLERLWAGLHAADVYRSDALGIGASGARWLSALAFGWWRAGAAPRALLDSRPLVHLVQRSVDFARIEGAIARRALHAVSITCSGYDSGQSVSFFQGRADLEPWKGRQRFGAHVKLGVDHVMASGAIPFAFPAVRLHREWFGDGAMRQLAPISPALRLGAERVVVIGAAGRSAADAERPRSVRYPSLAQTAGHMLSGVFLDSLSADLEQLIRINELLGKVPEAARREGGVALRQIPVLHIAPSERLDHLALRHLRALPRSVRALLHGIGANQHGGALASYLLFEQSYTRALIALGYADAMNRGREVAAFLE